MNSIKFRIAAKTDVGLVRTNNEDNLQASADLSAGMRWVNNEICSLGDKGALLVVADGMGGMNAGEVASELAIETVRQWFAPERLTPEVTATRFTIEKFMKEAIVAADARIKSEAKARPETKGMGTTIVLGWILDGKLYISWCGDSRAYVYNPDAGLHQITKDHSYVQGLVDKGAISREEAFDFPDSNIITRCLSDGSTKAKPESLLRPYELCDNDIILLCTDGLSGMIRDSEMESVIRANEHNTDTLVDSLITAACNAEGSDNITICLCQVLQGGQVCNPTVFDEYDRRLEGGSKGFMSTIINKPDSDGEAKPRDRKMLYFGAGCLSVLVVCFAVWWFFLREKPVHEKEEGGGVTAQEQNDPTAGNQESQPAGTDARIDYTDQAGTPVREESGTPAQTITPSVVKQITAQPEADPAPHRQVTKPAARPNDELTPIDNDESGDGGATLTPVNRNEKESPEHTEYTVKKGDSYYGIAKKFNVNSEALQRLNGGVELKAGMKIKIPK